VQAIAMANAKIFALSPDYHHDFEVSAITRPPISTATTRGIYH
jgi:hypothetical protein